MIRVGTVNIDTSHPHAFADIFLAGERARYTAIYNDAFRTDDEVNAFVTKYGLEKRYTSLDEMAGNVDIAFIQGCNWDRHIELAAPFLKAGKPVFIDKPFVGSLEDCEKALNLSKKGAVLLGSSAMRYTYEHRSILSVPEQERGQIVHVTATVGVDEFNYAIHAVESILGFFRGTSAESVMFTGKCGLGGSECCSYRISFENGASGEYHICTPAWQPSTLTVVTTKTTYAVKIDSSKVYEALLGQVLDFMEGKPNDLATVEELCEATKIMLAGKQSEKEGRTVRLDELSGEHFFDGAAFEKYYEAQQRKG